MRFDFGDTDRPSELAGAIGRRLADLGFRVGRADLLDLTARMTGHRDWRALAGSVGTAPASLDDDSCEPPVVLARRAVQVAELRALGLTELQAYEAAGETQPTNRLPDPTVTWKPWKGGRYTVDAGRAYWVGPAIPETGANRRPRVNFGLPGDEDLPFHMRYCKPAGDGVAFDEAYGPRGFRSLEDAVRDIEDTVRAARLQRRDERLLERSKLTVDEARAIDAPWGTSTEYATRHALGVLEVSCDRHGGFRVPAEVLENMPLALRSWQDDEGFGWYEEDCESALLMLGLPGLFTVQELRYARGMAERTYPAILDIVDGRAPDDPVSVRRAKRGFTEERITWHPMLHLVDMDDVDAEGMVRVQATMSDYWGSNPPSREEMRTPRTFLVPASELAERDDDVLGLGPGFEIDPDRHEAVEETSPGPRH